MVLIDRFLSVEESSDGQFLIFVRATFLRWAEKVENCHCCVKNQTEYFLELSA